LEALNINNTVIEEMKECGSQMSELDLRTLLGCFLFSGDDVEKKIKVLSGGEKARVALAKTMISKANFLMLDEPTNHLDMHSCDLLIDALKKYEGSFILVSHDRYFISKTANKIWEIDNHQIKEFKGNYEEWVAWKVRMADRREKEDGGRQKVPDRSMNDKRIDKETEKSKNVNSSTTGNTPINKEHKKELQKQQQFFKQLEERLALLAKEKTAIESSLADPSVYTDKNKFVLAEANYNKTLQHLSVVNKQYEETFEKIVLLEENQKNS
jgi:ATP-binding cassette subfamily F protein 3